MSIDLATIDTLIATIDAPDGWVFMGHDGAFPLEIRESRNFREVVTLTGDPNDMAEAIALLPTALLALREEVDRLDAELSTANDAFTEMAKHARIMSGTIDMQKEEIARLNAELLSAQDGYAEMAFQNSLTP